MEDIIVPKINVVVQQFDAKTGELLHTQKTHNLVVNSGLNVLRDALRTGTCSPLTQFALGSFNTVVTAAQTGLQQELLKAAFTSPIVSNEQQLVVFYYLTSATLVGSTIREAGLFTQNNTMYARVVLPTPITKTNLIEASFTWTLNWGAS